MVIDIPTLDDSVQIGGENRVIRGLNNGGKSKPGLNHCLSADYLLSFELGILPLRNDGCQNQARYGHDDKEHVQQNSIDKGSTGGEWSQPQSGGNGCDGSNRENALTIALASPPSTISPSASDKRASDVRKPTIRCNRKAPARTASVAPVACPTAVIAGTGLRNAMRNAPAATASQTRYPQISNAASAMPYAGHTGPIFPLLTLAVA